MASGSVYKLAFVGVGPQNQELVTTLHYKAAQGTIFDTQAEDLVQAVLADLDDDFLACFASGSFLTGLTVRGVTDPTEGFDYAYSAAQPGARSSDDLPPQMSPVITWTTGLVGRRYRGRMFVWPPGENDQSKGVLNSGYLGVLDAFGASALQIGDGILTAVYDLVIYSRTYDISTPVTGYVPRNIIHVQRRRAAGVGS